MGNKMIKKIIPNGLYKNGKPKTKQITVAEGDAKWKKKIILQGERIEHPEFIEKNKIKLDYKFYISNQIMNPVKQVLDINMEPEETKKIFEQFIK